jgi:hypothetical protein
MKTTETFAAKGFSIEATSGSNEGFIRYVDPDERDLTAYLFVTDADGALPENLTDPVLVGIYDSAGSSLKLRFPSARAFLATLDD